MSFYEIAQKHNVDHLYKSACFSEANWLRGTECLFYPCIEYKRDIESDFHAKLGDPVVINVALEEYSEAELEKMNYIAESDNLPFQAFISNIIWTEFIKARREYINQGNSFKDFFRSCFNEKSELITDQPWYVRVSKFAILEFPYIMEKAGTQKFRLMKIMGDQTNPFIWKCQIVPHRDQVDLIPSTTNIADPVTTYDKTAPIVGKAFTKQKNLHTKPGDEFPPEPDLPAPDDDEFIKPTDPEKEPEPEAPEPPDIDEPSEPEPPIEPEEPETPDHPQIEVASLDDLTNPYNRMYSNNAANQIKRK